MNDSNLKLVVLELYSGIGGMHYALEASGIPFDVISAIDINQICNSIYHHNFPHTKLITKCLTTLTLSELNTFKADMITMSPPCQPFTRVGKQQDAFDERTKSFLHFLNLLPKLDKIPQYILLENVKGFECSLTRDALLKVLNKLDFVFQEFLLTPLQFSIPNSRLRYYLLAKRKPFVFAFNTQPNIHMTLPAEFDSRENNHRLLAEQMCSTSGRKSMTESKCSITTGDSKVRSDFCDDGKDKTKNDNSTLVRRPLSEYLEDQPAEYFEQYLLPKKFYRYFWVMDLVPSDSTTTCCFTKRYGHHIDGAGSVLQMKPSEEDLTEYRNLKNVPEFIAGVEALQLRFFTPREIANLLCFPSHFNIPENVTTLQSYRVLGNSINVYVVSVLLRLLVNS